MKAIVAQRLQLFTGSRAGNHMSHWGRPPECGHAACKAPVESLPLIRAAPAGMSGPKAAGGCEIAVAPGKYSIRRKNRIAKFQ
jgi:hypothetical protein